LTQLGGSCFKDGGRVFQADLEVHATTASRATEALPSRALPDVYPSPLRIFGEHELGELNAEASGEEGGGETYAGLTRGQVGFVPAGTAFSLCMRGSCGGGGGGNEGGAAGGGGVALLVTLPPQASWEAEVREIVTVLQEETASAMGAAPGGRLFPHHHRGSGRAAPPRARLHDAISRLCSTVGRRYGDVVGEVGEVGATEARRELDEPLMLRSSGLSAPHFDCGGWLRARHGSLDALLDEGGGRVVRRDTHELERAEDSLRSCIDFGFLFRQVLRDFLPPTVADRIQRSILAIGEDEWIDTRGADTR